MTAKSPAASGSMAAWRRQLFAAGLAAVLMLVLSGCSDNCTDADGANDGGSKGNTCLKDHCKAHVSAAGCLEDGKHDGDCCAMSGAGGCATGYSFKKGAQCHSIGAVTTCCTPKCDQKDTANECDTRLKSWADQKDTAVGNEEEESPRWWVSAAGFILGFGYCFACCCGIANDEPVKNNLGEEAKKRVWLVVIAVCVLTAVLYHAVFNPMARDKGLMALMGGTGDMAGLLAGVCLLIWYKPWLNTRLARRGQAPAAVAQAPPVAPAVVVVGPAPSAVASTQDNVVVSATVVGTSNQANSVIQGTVVGTPVPLCPGASFPNKDFVQELPEKDSSVEYPSLAAMVEEFKRELGVGGNSILETVDAACAQLSVPDGSSGIAVLKRAETCWRILHGTKPSGAASTV